MYLSVIIPIYNEEECIRNNLERLHKFLKDNIENSFEIIAVNDGSADSTYEILKKLDFIQLVTYKKNKGKGYAVKRGIMKAKGSYVFFTDADLSYSPENIIKGIGVLTAEKSEYVVGVRKNKKEEYPFLRRIASDVFLRIARGFLNLNFEDIQCGFKGFKKNAAKNIFPSVRESRFSFDLELIFCANMFEMKASVLPVSFDHREGGHIHLFKDSARMIGTILKIKFGRHMSGKAKYFEEG